MVVTSLIQYDSTHELVEELYRKVLRDDDWHVTDLQKIKTTLETMKSDCLYLLFDRDYFLKLAEIYAAQPNRKKDEIEGLRRMLKNVREALSETQLSLLGAENQIKLMEHSREHENRMRQEFFQEIIDELENS